MRLFSLCTLCCALLLVAPLRAAVQQLNYQPNDLPAMPAPMLNDADWHWLGQKARQRDWHLWAGSATDAAHQS